MLKLILAFVTTLTLLPAFAQDPVRRTDELMRKSGLWKQLSNYDTLILAGLEQELGKAGDLPDREDLQKAAKAFSADNLRRDVRTVLAKEMSAADEAEVLVWLATDTGKRITLIEEKYSEVDGRTIQQRQEAIAEYAKSIPPQRMALLKRMTAALDAGNASAKSMGNMAIAIAYGAAMATGGEADVATKLRREFEAQRPQMAVMLDALMAATYGYMYRAVSDEELTRYVDFIETPAGLRYHDASGAAIDSALTRASLRFGQELGELARKQPHTKKT